MRVLLVLLALTMPASAAPLHAYCRNAQGQWLPCSATNPLAVTCVRYAENLQCQNAAGQWAPCGPTNPLSAKC